MLEVTIDGNHVQVSKDLTILEAARLCGISIPTLCSCGNGNVFSGSSCRLCIVEIEGENVYYPACSTRVWDGMLVRTSTPDIQNTRRMILQLIFSTHQLSCPTCAASDKCELIKLSSQTGLKNASFSLQKKKTDMLEENNSVFIRDPGKCVLCGRCVSVCSELQSVGSISLSGRGKDFRVEPAFPNVSPCTGCGECFRVCPTGGVMIRNNIDEICRVIQKSSETQKIAIISPHFSLDNKLYDFSISSIVYVLRRLGFKKVYSSETASNMEAWNIFQHLKSMIPKSSGLIFSSVCPAVVKFTENFFPEMLSFFSSLKSSSALMSEIVKNMDKPNSKSVKQPVKVVFSFSSCFSERIDNNHLFIDHFISDQEFCTLLSRFGIILDKNCTSDFDNAGGKIPSLHISQKIALQFKRESASVDTRALFDNNFLDKCCSGEMFSSEISVNGQKIVFHFSSGLKNVREVFNRISDYQSDGRIHVFEMFGCSGESSCLFASSRRQIKNGFSETTCADFGEVKDMIQFCDGKPDIDECFVRKAPVRKIFC
ncbi:MAG: (2Fe-2S)-binding protein [Candidatus Riflebacteria bacterium]|nr:(2Fe-2S)-binding protein [Candidatus Riflebacteria bacterium]